MFSVKENTDISRFVYIQIPTPRNMVNVDNNLLVLIDVNNYCNYLKIPPRNGFLEATFDEKFQDIAQVQRQVVTAKVVLIMRVAGRCRIGELVTITVDDVNNKVNVLVDQLPGTKTNKKRIFTVINGDNSVFTIDVFR
ncbi:hypothetical protein NQ314_018124, partial [Rhamnusium bicolor]